MEFLVAHEYGHLCLGHVQYMAAKIGKPFIAELGWSVGGSFDAITSQALELDADAYSATRGLYTLLACIDNPQIVDERSRLLYKDAEAALRMWLFAVFTLFRILGEGVAWEVDSLGASTHPHPRIRQRGVLAALSSVLELRRPDLQARLRPVVKEVMVEVEQAFALLTGNPAKADEVNAAFSDPRVMEHIRAVLQRGRAIEAELNALSAIGPA